MKFGLKNQDNDTLIEVVVYLRDSDLDAEEFVEISTSVNVFNYSFWLLQYFSADQHDDVILDFDELSDLRRWLYDIYFENKDYSEDIAENDFPIVAKGVKNKFSVVAEKYNLLLIEEEL